MSKRIDIQIDADSIAVDIKRITNLLNIVIDDFEDNGALEARRELTGSALCIIRDHLDLLADMQSGIADRIREAQS